MLGSEITSWEVYFHLFSFRTGNGAVPKAALWTGQTRSQELPVAPTCSGAATGEAVELGPLFPTLVSFWFEYSCIIKR